MANINGLLALLGQYGAQRRGSQMEGIQSLARGLTTAGAGMGDFAQQQKRLDAMTYEKAQDRLNQQTIQNRSQQFQGEQNQLGRDQKTDLFNRGEESANLRAAMAIKSAEERLGRQLTAAEKRQAASIAAADMRQHYDQKYATEREQRQAQRADKRQQRGFDRADQLSDIEWEREQARRSAQDASGAAKERERNQARIRELLIAAKTSGDPRAIAQAEAVAKAHGVDLGDAPGVSILSGTPSAAREKLAAMLRSDPQRGGMSPGAKAIPSSAGGNTDSAAIRQAMAVLNIPAVANPDAPARNPLERAYKTLVSTVPKMRDYSTKEIVDSFIRNVSQAPEFRDKIVGAAKKEQSRSRRASPYKYDYSGNLYGPDGALIAKAGTPELEAAKERIAQELGGAVDMPGVNAGRNRIIESAVAGLTGETLNEEGPWTTDMVARAKNKYGGIAGGGWQDKLPRMPVMVNANATANPAELTKEFNRAMLEAIVDSLKGDQ